MIGWIQFSKAEIKKAEDALKTQELGVRDEIGFLNLHQAIADRLFPGTSVLHTRLRYVLFVPWLMERSDGDPALLRKHELALTGQLKASSAGWGIIGGSIHPNEPMQPASTVYWSAISRWGILRPRIDGISISRGQALKKIASDHHAHGRHHQEVDGEALHPASISPFITLPPPPVELLKTGAPISFKLTTSERDFLRKQFIGVRYSQHSQDQSLLARLAETRIPLQGDPLPWDKPIRGIATPDDQAIVLLAKYTASLAGIGRAVYAALLEEMKAAGSGYSSQHRDHLKLMVFQHGRLAQRLDLTELYSCFSDLQNYLKQLLNETQSWLASPHKSVMQLHEIYRVAEFHRKGARARLDTTVGGIRRRAEWESDAHPLAEPLHYRWNHVRTLMNDLAAK